MITPKVSMRTALADPNLLGNLLQGDSFRTWRTFLIGQNGEPLDDAETATFARFTNGRKPPTERISEALYLIGRRGGKDRAISTYAAYIATLMDTTAVLSPGETGTVLCVGPDQRQARIQRNYIEAAFAMSPFLKGQIVNLTADRIELKRNIAIEVRAASFRNLRGLTALAVICTEASFFYTDDATENSDAEILNAVRPSLATTGGSLIIITSPHTRRGEVHTIYQRDFRPDGDPAVLVIQAASKDFNPTLSEKFLNRQRERDPEKFRSEYEGQFRDDISAYISSQVLEQAVAIGADGKPIFERQYDVSKEPYHSFVDAAGGSGSDSFTLGISHLDDATGHAILDLVIEYRPPFSPATVIEGLVPVLRRFNIDTVTGDAWARGFVEYHFTMGGIHFRPSDLNKTAIYQNFLSPLNSGMVKLLGTPRLLMQFRGLERTVARGTGRETIDHGPNQHDDICNSAAGSLLLALDSVCHGPTIVFDGIRTGLVFERESELDRMRRTLMGSGTLLREI